MKSKAEIKKFLLENCVDEDGNLDLSDLDFSDFEGKIVCISNWKVKKDLYQYSQKVGGDLIQDCQEVYGGLWQSQQKVCGKLYQDDMQEQIIYCPYCGKKIR